MYLKIIEIHQSCHHQNYSKPNIQNYSNGFIASMNVIFSYTFAFMLLAILFPIRHSFRCSYVFTAEKQEKIIKEVSVKINWDFCYNIHCRIGCKFAPKMLRFTCCMASKAQLFLVRICNLFDLVLYNESAFMPF